MTDVTTLLAGIKTRATAATDYPGHVTVEQSAADVPRLVAAIEAVEDLAKVWNARGEHDMVYSKTIPDEDIAIELLTHGADMVEKARILRAAVVAALGGGE